MRRLVLTLVIAGAAFASGPLRFRITVARSVAPQGASGRLIVLMSDQQEKQDVLKTGFLPDGVWIAAQEVEFVGPGGSIEFNPDIKSYPRPFSHAKSGAYQFMALLDTDHTYVNSGLDQGDFYSSVVLISNLDPAHSDPLTLVIDRRGEAGLPPFAETEQIKVVELESRLLTAFWGRPIRMRASVVLPPSYAQYLDRLYPGAYMVHGFGGNHEWAARHFGQRMVNQMQEHKRAEMVHVFLDGSFASGHHTFADSANNGPWGRALTEEFIPILEKRYRLNPRPEARFLWGHSSGGWSTLWLQVNYPGIFGGVWSVAPDPVDFRSFTTVNVTPDSHDNAYRTADGKPRNLARKAGKDWISMEEFTRHEDVLGEFGGQIASFDWVFSPKGPDGRPMRLFNHVTGEGNPFVKEAWRKYDIRLKLAEDWPSLAPKLQGKLRVIVGTEDTFHLEEGVYLLCDFLKSKGWEDVCTIVPGRDHSDVFRPHEKYPDGLELLIDREMQKAFERGLR